MPTAITNLETFEFHDSPYGERNQQPILKILQEYLSADADVLEIGSGTGQHAVFFTRHMPAVSWQMTEMPENLKALQARRLQQGNTCLAEPGVIDCRDPHWDLPQQYDAAFSANTAHIMSWEGVCGMFQGVGKALKPEGLFFLYGPFRYHGKDTAQSTTDFHRQLHSRSAEMGLRDYYELQTLAETLGMRLNKDISMPANNRILIFQNG
jgi:cyclopropane fatty-acyl-phospholipid synthase-like methyltransferase